MPLFIQIKCSSTISWAIHKNEQNIHRTTLTSESACPAPARQRLTADTAARGDQMACKPGSVPPPPERRRDDHSSGPSVAGRFSRPTRAPGPAKPCPPRGGRGAPIRSCSRRGLPCRPGHPVRGGLLPHPFTLTARAAVCFLWRYPWGRPRRALPAALSSWSPDFPPPHRNAGATARPSGPLAKEGAE